MYNHTYKFGTGPKKTVIDYLELQVGNRESINFLELDEVEIQDVPKTVSVFYLEMFLNSLYELEEQKEIVENLSKEVFKD